MRAALVLAAAGALLAPPLAAQTDPAANYPSHSVRVVVTVPAGGGVDSVTRIFADKLQRRLGQPFVVENQGGAGGNVAASTVFAAAPDGYTLMSSQPAPLTTNMALYKKLSFDPTAFEPVVIMSRFPNVLLVRKDFPAKTAAEFIAYAKANPGRLNYGSQGIGTTSHLTTELFMSLTGTRMVHVPYKGTAPALNDLLAGQIDFIFMELSSAVKLHESGNARILAIATDKRLESLPDIPTMIEAGVPNFVSDTWNALSAPPKTPAAIAAKLNQAVNEIIAEPETKKQFEKLNLLPAGGTPSDMARFVKAETKRWTDVIHRAGIEPE
ncbi:MAG TPA: tripartite tricarboxylate transporter substrate binding protein [Xanthobacteraceae bacterium]|nr:tripartite tricarboxylate transporter substrate binding protein [Xanthobacteraceae bacterium]